MTIFSFLLSGLLLIVFDRKGVDWVGVSYLDDLAEKPSKSKLENLIVALVKKEASGLDWLGQTTLFVALSIFVDPFVVAIYYRRKQFAGITGRDWNILIASVSIANLYWTLRTGFLVMVIKEVLQKLSHGW